MRGDPKHEVNAWLEKLAEVEAERRGYQRLAAKGHMTDEELDEALSELEETRKTAERELEVLRTNEEYVRELEAGRDALLDSLEAQAPEALNSLTPEERQQWYKLLGLRADVRADGMVEVSWTGSGESRLVCETATLSLSAARSG